MQSPPTRRHCQEDRIAFDRSPRRDDRVRTNERIRVREIRVIDETGQQLGIMAPPQALAIARQKGLDLVEISPTAVPPVCRIMDFGKYQYQEQKRSREAKKHQKVIEVKEIKFRPKVDEHDYQFKKKHIERFLAEGDKVKATIFFRGREMAHPEIGRRILERLLGRAGRRGDCRDDAAPGRQPDARDPGTAGRAQERAEGADRRATAGVKKSPRWKGKGVVGHAETEDAPGRRQAVQEDRHGEVHPGASAFKRHILTSKTTKVKRTCGRTRRCRTRTPRSCG